MIAAAYIRVSTEDQVEFSPDSQLKRIQEYAQQHDIQIPKEYIFIDEGISGRTASKRPAFQQMISLAKSTRPFQKILVWKFSRFARNRQDSIFYKSMLRKDCGIEVISITEPLTPDPTSILIEALLEAMDEYYSINLAQEVRRGMQERFSRGRPISVPPFGYRMEEDGFEVNPLEAPWVLRIFEDYANGKQPLDIANELNGAGVRTIRGNAFEARSIVYILHNPVYVGKLRRRPATPYPNYSCDLSSDSFSASLGSVENSSFGNDGYLQGFRGGYDRYYIQGEMELVDGNHQPLISEELWERVQERWQREVLNRQGEIRALKSDTPVEGELQNSYLVSCPCKPEYFLKGVVHCSDCGRILVQVRHGAAFQCSGYNHGLCNVSHYVNSQQLVDMTWNTLGSMLSPQELLLLKDTSLTVEVRNRFLQGLPYQLVYQKKENRVQCAPYSSHS